MHEQFYLLENNTEHSSYIHAEMDCDILVVQFEKSQSWKPLEILQMNTSILLCLLCSFIMHTCCNEKLSASTTSNSVAVVLVLVEVVVVRVVVVLVKILVVRVVLVLISIFFMKHKMQSKHNDEGINTVKN